MNKFALKPFRKVYLLENTIFANKFYCSVLQKCNLKNYSINRMLHTFASKSSKKLLGTERHSLRKLQLVKGIRPLCSESGKTEGLMNSRIHFYVPFLKKLIFPLEHYRFRQWDSEFKIPEFIESAKYVLEVVTKSLSNETYDELEPLLTNQCKTEVENNVKMMSPEKRVDLAINSSDIMFCDYYLNSHTGDKDGKTTGEVTMIYFIPKGFKLSQPVPFINPFDAINKDVTVDKESCPKSIQVYNCTFIKEFTKDSNNQWKINKINCIKLELNYAKTT